MSPALTAAIGALFILAFLTLGYLGACWIWPFAACRRCGGSGRHRSPRGRAWRDCRRCKGTGARLRTGRRAINLVRRLHRDSLN